MVPSRARAGPPDIGASIGARPSADMRAARRDRRAQQHRGARRHRCSGAVGPEQHRLGLRRIDHGDDQCLAARGQRRRRRGHVDAGGLRERGAARIDVPHGDVKAALAQPLRHRPAHVADADDADACHYVCTRRRLREIDIRMPSPSPSVTIAVPP
jgi:hypothetical protein